MTTFEWIYLWTYAIYMFGIYGPSARRYRRVVQIEKPVSRPVDILLDMLAFAGWIIIPLVKMFSGWLDFADYTLPDWSGWLGVGILAAAMVIYWLAYTRLGKNWSPKIEISRQQELITDGIYGVIRHPIYFAMCLWCLGQPLLLHNWIAGFGLLAAFLPLIILRLPREEHMMIEHFGQAYRDYMKRVGGMLPRP
jgi:protein-S-isoprenylcysteine O-methyltransferase Ste14